METPYQKEQGIQPEPVKQPKKISRRGFLKLAGAVVVTTAACGALGWSATLPPKIDYPEDSFTGADAMSKKILVTYATRAGSTAEVAEAIGKTLSAKGAAVDVLPIKKVTDLTGYQAVVIGSAVRFGQWLPEAVKFVESNNTALSQKSTAFFAVHIMNLGEDETSRKARLAYLDPARKLITPKAEAFFAGSGNPSKLSFLERTIGRMVKSPEGDLRDWKAINAWAESLPTLL